MRNFLFWIEKEIACPLQPCCFVSLQPKICQKIDVMAALQRISSKNGRLSLHQTKPVLCAYIGKRAQEGVGMAGQAEPQRQPEEGGAGQPRLPRQEAVLHHQGQANLHIMFFGADFDFEY